MILTAKKKALLSKQARLDTHLAEVQGALAEISRQLADPVTYADLDGEAIRSLNVRHENLAAEVAQLEEDWLEMEVALEEIIPTL